MGDPGTDKEIKIFDVYGNLLAINRLFHKDIYVKCGLLICKIKNRLEV